MKIFSDFSLILNTKFYIKSNSLVSEKERGNYYNIENLTNFKKKSMNLPKVTTLGTS